MDFKTMHKNALKDIEEMTSNKYIIRNCPACYLYGNKYGCEDNHDKQGRDTYCELVDDCVMKQIVEKCCERYVGFLEESFIKDEILNLFQIEEVE